MVRDRSIGVREARLGLSLLTVVLVVLGYVVLQRLGGTGKSPTVEIIGPKPSTDKDHARAPTNEGELQVLHVQEAATTEAPQPRTSRLPLSTPLEPKLDDRSDLRINGLESLWRATPLETIITPGPPEELRR